MVVTAGGEVVGHDVSIVDEEDGKGNVVLDLLTDGLGGNRAVFSVGEDRDLAAGFEDSVFDGTEVGVALGAELFEEFVHGKAVAGHIFLKDFTVADNDGWVTADEGAEAD